MQAAIDALVSHPEVLGASIIQGGETCAASLPVFFDAQALQEAVSSLMRTLNAPDAHMPRTRGFEICFGDTTLTVRALSESYHLALLTRGPPDEQTLRARLEVLEGRMRALEGEDPLVLLPESRPDHSQDRRPDHSQDRRPDHNQDGGTPFTNGSVESPFSLRRGAARAGTQATRDSSAREGASPSNGSPSNGEARLEAPAVLPPAQLERLELELARFIGPVAGLLVKEVSRSSTRAALFDALAVYIDADGDRQIFLERATALSQ